MPTSRNDLFPGPHKLLYSALLVGVWLLVAVLVILFATLVRSHARALYPGQYAQYTDQERAWFRTQRSPKGIPCCDVADGHRTTWRHGDKGYEVPITDDAQVIRWLAVPAEAVIENAKNPTRDSIVWYRDYGPTFPNDSERWAIRCFVPGDGA